MKKYILGIYFWIVFLPIIPTRVRCVILFLSGVGVRLDTRLAPGSFLGGRNIIFGKKVVININCFFDGSELITIGDFVRMGPYVRILTGSHSYAPSVIRRGKGSHDINLPVVISRGCWIGMGVTILPGVKIAEGCVIAAGALVNKSTQPNGLYAGMPALRVKDLPV